jgi:hypothetical protein
MRSLVAGSSSAGSLVTRSGSSAAREGVEDGVGVRHRRRAAGRAPGPWKTSSPARTPPARGSRARPGARHAARGGRPGLRSPRRAGRRYVVGMALELVGEGERPLASSSSSPPGTSARAATTPATIAADDEPSPRDRAGCGSCSAGTARPAACRAGRRPPERADDEVALVERTAPPPPPRRRPGRRRRHPDDDVVVQVEREPGAVEPGPRFALVAGTRTCTGSSRRSARQPPGVGCAAAPADARAQPPQAA